MSEWTAERHEEVKTQLDSNDMDRSFLLEMEFPDALAEIERLQTELECLIP